MINRRSVEPSPSWPHAVIIGGGYGGLLTARVLADYFDRVTILEQDVLTGTEDYRSGVPQARHPHALLARGAQLLEQLFPGLRVELAARGAPVIDFAAGTRLLLPAGWAPRDPIGFDVQMLARTALEHAIRGRVAALPNVTTVDGFRVDNVVFEPGTYRALGVTGHHAGEPGRDVPYTADLIVDASGRASRLPGWLEQASLGRPRQTVVDGRLTYASRLYQSPETADYDWAVSYQAVLSGLRQRGGGVARFADRRCLVTLIGAGGLRPPADEDAFLAYARTLHNPDIADIISTGTPLGPIYRTTALANRWTRYDRMPRWPGNLVAVGDSVCALNPVYGQSMTLTALHSQLLGRMIHQTTGGGDLTGFSRRFQRRAAAVIRLPWILNSVVDQVWQDDIPGRSRLAGWYLDHVQALVPTDPDIFRRFARAMNMLDSPAALSHPRVLLRVLRHALVTAGADPGPRVEPPEPRNDGEIPGHAPVN